MAARGRGRDHLYLPGPTHQLRTATLASSKLAYKLLGLVDDLSSSIDQSAPLLSHSYWKCIWNADCGLGRGRPCRPVNVLPRGYRTCCWRHLLPPHYRDAVLLYYIVETYFKEFEFSRVGVYPPHILIVIDNTQQIKMDNTNIIYAIIYMI